MAGPTKLLFIAREGETEPWYGEFVRAVGGSFEIVQFDAARPAAKQLAGITAVIDNGGHASREVVDAAAAAGVGLWLAVTTGLDHVDVDYILRRGLRLANTPGEYSAVALAEHALMLILCFAKHLRESARNLRAGRMHQPVNTELRGAALGLVGLGRSGRELARLATCLGLKVFAVDEAAPAEADLGGIELAWFGPPAELPRLLAEADYISLHVPLTRETRHLIGRDELAVVRPTAVLINVARGELVDEAALFDALASGRLAGAGLDVFSVEPPDPSEPLLALPHVIATPHVAGVTVGTARRRAAACVENARRFVSGEALLHEVHS